MSHVNRPPPLAAVPPPPPDDNWQPSDDDAPDAPPKSSETSGDRPQLPPGFTLAGSSEIFGPLPPINYLLGPLDMCPGAPVLVAGYGFSGKTVALQSMALSIACGQRVWDAFAAEQGRVVHIDYEQGSRLTYERYQRLAYDMGVGPGDLGDRLNVVTMPPMYLDGPVGMTALLRAAEGCRMVLIDSLRACAPSVDENSSEIRRVLDGLGRVSEATGATVVVIHHARKPQKEAAGGAKASIRGSGAIFDACGSVVVFEGPKGQPVRVSHEKARNSGILKGDFELAIEDVADEHDPRRGLRVSAQAADSLGVATASPDATVLAWVTEHPGASGRQVVASLGMKKNPVYDSLARLEVDGLVVSKTGPKRSITWWPKA